AATPLSVDVAADDDAAMTALGEAAFFAYPAQLAPYAFVALSSRSAASGYGLWLDEARDQVGGLVRTQLADGTNTVAMTCSTCHAATGVSGLVVGVGSDALDLGRMIADGGGGGAAWRSWGRGRVDVTTTVGTAPERIPDLRPVRWLTHLHQEATVAQHGRIALAIRLETLIITAHSQAIRPPRAVTWALATYLNALADGLPSLAPASDAATRGEQTFQAQCSSCHAGAGLTGPPTLLAVVGTDPAIGLSTDRGTGMYRVPSLRGVGTRGLLLHDASLPSLAAMWDPTRTSAVFAGGTRGAGAVPGHVYGLDLDDATRADLVEYLRGL
ncbi:MAG: c-type cytochrome, partial [Polyangiales bacterium]